MKYQVPIFQLGIYVDFVSYFLDLISTYVPRSPGRRQPHQIGVQGGFFVVRPNETDFNNYIDIILSGGNFKIGYGWGGKKLRYGGYYGAGTIQGLASYYYGHFARNRSIELNRCYFNAMVDSPMGIDDDSSRCRTLEEKCEDCRAVNITKIFSAHFTVCGKPYKCHALSEPLCRKLHHKWHLVRLSLEMEWVERFPGYIFSPMQNTTQKLSEGHCKRNGRKGTYIPLIYPLESNDTS